MLDNVKFDVELQREPPWKSVFERNEFFLTLMTNKCMKWNKFNVDHYPQKKGENQFEKNPCIRG